MNIQEIEEYKKTAKIGDRLKSIKYGQITYVRNVVERGVITSLREDRPDHQFLWEWSSLERYDLIHKEK